MAKNDFHYDRWKFLHPAMWILTPCDDTDYAGWQHPAMWHVALGSWQWIHQVAVGLPCDVTRGSGMTCHWIRQVAAPYNVACGSGIMTVNSQSGNTLQRDTWLWDDVTEFARWQHPPMWHVALESWQWIHQVAAPCNVIRGSGMTCHWIRPVAAPCNVTGGSGMTCHWIRPNVHHIGIAPLQPSVGIHGTL